MTKASSDTQKKKEEGKEGERKKTENRCSQLRASVQGHTKDQIGQ